MSEETLNQDQKQRLNVIKKTLSLAEKSVKEAILYIDELTGNKEISEIDKKRIDDLQEKAKDLNISEEERIIEGVFDGQNMIGPDQKMYPIPANYASKSKLVEGDILKLTIQEDGTFLYKQIGPVERNKIIGDVIKENGEYTIEAEGKKYKVLLASITYFKAEPGDEVTIVVPRDKECTWAAIENVIKKNPEESPQDEDNLELGIDKDLEDI